MLLEQLSTLLKNSLPSGARLTLNATVNPEEGHKEEAEITVEHGGDPAAQALGELLKDVGLHSGQDFILAFKKVSYPVYARDHVRLIFCTPKSFEKFKIEIDRFYALAVQNLPSPLDVARLFHMNQKDILSVKQETIGLENIIIQATSMDVAQLLLSRIQSILSPGNTYHIKSLGNNINIALTAKNEFITYIKELNFYIPHKKFLRQLTALDNKLSEMSDKEVQGLLALYAKPTPPSSVKSPLAKYLTSTVSSIKSVVDKECKSYYISTDNTDIFEHTLLRLANIREFSTYCRFKDDGDGIVKIILDLSLARILQFICWFNNTYGKETAWYLPKYDPNYETVCFDIDDLVTRLLPDQFKDQLRKTLNDPLIQKNYQLICNGEHITNEMLCHQMLSICHDAGLRGDQFVPILLSSVGITSIPTIAEHLPARRYDGFATDTDFYLSITDKEAEHFVQQINIRFPNTAKIIATNLYLKENKINLQHISLNNDIFFDPAFIEKLQVRANQIADQQKIDILNTKTILPLPPMTERSGSKTIAPSNLKLEEPTFLFPQPNTLFSKNKILDNNNILSRQQLIDQFSISPTDIIDIKEDNLEIKITASSISTAQTIATKIRNTIDPKNDYGNQLRAGGFSGNEPTVVLTFGAREALKSYRKPKGP